MNTGTRITRISWHPYFERHMDSKVGFGHSLTTNLSTVSANSYELTMITPTVQTT